MYRFLFVIALIFFFTTAQADSLSLTEKQITQFAIQQHNEQVLLLEKLVNINSGTTNISGVHQVGGILRLQLEQLGFKTKWVEEPASMNRAGTLVAEHKGTRGKKILLIGHLDTVFPKDSLFQKFSSDKNIASGPGVIDDKGGDVIILFALKTLQSAGVLKDMNITVVLTGDEEDSGKPTSISRKSLIDAAKNNDIALDFEWAMSLDTAAIARRGVTNWTIDTTGIENHSSEIFQKSAGFGAIFEMTRILNEIREQLSHEKYLSVSPGIILGGTSINDKKTISGKNNVIPKIATATGDLRYLTLDQQINAKKKISEIIKHNLPGTTATIHWQDGIPSMPPTSGNMNLLNKYSRVSRDLGYGNIKELDPGMRGAGDISHVASMMSGNLVGLGAFGTGAHTTNETLDLNSLLIQTQRAALLIYREY